MEISTETLEACMSPSLCVYKAMEIKNNNIVHNMNNRVNSLSRTILTI